MKGPPSNTKGQSINYEKAVLQYGGATIQYEGATQINRFHPPEKTCLMDWVLDAELCEQLAEAYQVQLQGVAASQHHLGAAPRASIGKSPELSQLVGKHARPELVASHDDSTRRFLNAMSVAWS